jgi:hypothetical protein
VSWDAQKRAALLPRELERILGGARERRVCEEASGRDRESRAEAKAGRGVQAKRVTKTGGERRRKEKRSIRESERQISSDRDRPEVRRSISVISLAAAVPPVLL